MKTNDGRVLSQLLTGLALILVALTFTMHVWVEPVHALDSDSDGMSDSFEMSIGTDPNNADTDGDNVNDFDEIYVNGTHPNMPDTDGDGNPDDTDTDPLNDGTDAGGRTSVSSTYTDGRDKPNLQGTTSMEQGAVNALSGEKITLLASVNMCPGTKGVGVMNVYHFSDISANWITGRNTKTNFDGQAILNSGVSITYLAPNGEWWTFTCNPAVSPPTYDAPAGLPATASVDTTAGEITITWIRGGFKEIYDLSAGYLKAFEDRFGNETALVRNAQLQLTSIDFPEGKSVSITYYPTGRIQTITGWDTAFPRTWNFVYNCYDELAKFTNAINRTTQYFYVNGTNTSLDYNLSHIKQPSGTDLISVEYTSSDNVSKVTMAGNNCTYTWGPTSTTVNDFAGNQRAWEYTVGNTYPDRLVQYSNRNVRTGDPETWTTHFSHNANNLQTKVVLPRGNSRVSTWNSNYCLTQVREKQDDTAADSATNDLISTFTYGSTYCQLEDSTDPEGSTTERTLNSDEQVTRIDYETITHGATALTIYETMTWNADGTIATHTDGEGVVTKYEYVASGDTKGLLWKVTMDYGTGKLNLLTTLGYSSYRYLTSMIDPNTNTWTYTTTKEGQRLTETSPAPLSYQTKFTWHWDGWILTKQIKNIDENGTWDTTNPWFVTRFGHDAIGRVTSVQEEISSSLTRTTNCTLDGNGNLTMITQPEGNQISQVFDERDLLASHTTGYGSLVAATEEWDYDLNGNPYTYENGCGKVTSYTHDLFDRLTGTETPLGHYVEYELEKCGHRSGVEWYDSSDDLLAATRYSYDEMHRMYEVTKWYDSDDDGVWDDLAAEKYTTSIEYDKRSLVVGVTDPRGSETEYVYDNARRQTRLQDALGNRVDYAYGTDYVVPSAIEEVEKTPGGSTQTFTTEQVMDVLHRVTTRRIVDRTLATNKHTHEWSYNSLSVWTTYEDAEGNETWRACDALGRILKTEVDLGGGNKIVTQFGYDKNDNQTLYSDDSGNETIYRFNDRDLQYEIEGDDGDKRTLTFNDDDTISGWTDENGTVVVNTYDNDGRLTARSITRATAVLGVTAEAYTYDGLARLTQAANSNSTVQISYDTLSRVLTQTQGPYPIGTSGKTFTYTYNKDHSRNSLEYPSGYELDYTVDAIGRWSDITEDGDATALVSTDFYGPSFRVEDVSYQSGSTEEKGYDGFRRVTSIDHFDSARTEFAGFSYGYDQMNNPLYEERSHDVGAGDIYAYDQAYRLKGAIIDSDDPSNEISDGLWDDGDESYQDKVVFNMDDLSNRMSVVTTPDGGSSTTVSYTSNALNQYTALGGATRTHDDNGNLIDDGTYDLSYDYRNNLVKVMQGVTVIMEAEFGPLGRRTKVTTDSGSTVVKFFYDGEHCVEEYDDSDNVLRKFVYGQLIDDIKAMIAPDVLDVDEDTNTTELTTYFYHHNRIGSVTHVTSVYEDLVEQYEYSPYGKSTIRDASGSDLSGQSAIGNPYMYTARRLDEATGFYHYRRRAYDPVAGRFLQQDPLGFIDGANTYQYAGSMPSRRIDPMGTDHEEGAGGRSPVGKNRRDKVPGQQHDELHKHRDKNPRLVEGTGRSDQRDRGERLDAWDEHKREQAEKAELEKRKEEIRKKRRERAAARKRARAAKKAARRAARVERLRLRLLRSPKMRIKWIPPRKINPGPGRLGRPGGFGAAGRAAGAARGLGRVLGLVTLPLTILRELKEKPWKCKACGATLPGGSRDGMTVFYGRCLNASCPSNNPMHSPYAASLAQAPAVFGVGALGITSSPEIAPTFTQWRPESRAGGYRASMLR